MKINRGRFRHKLTVLQKVETKNKFGGKVDGEFTDVFDFRANVQELSATDQIKQGVDINGKALSILAGYDRRLQFEHLLRYKGNVYSVKDVKPDEREISVIILAKREF